MTSFTKFIDFSFKIFQGIASYFTIILTARFLGTEDYSYLSVLGMVLVSICVVDLGFNTRLINNYLSKIKLNIDVDRNTESNLFFQIFKQRKKTLFKIFLLQILVFASIYLILEETFNANHPISYFIVSVFSLFVMFLGARFSSYLIALGKTRTLFKIQGLGSILQLFVIVLIGESNLTLISYIPVLALPNLLVIKLVFGKWFKTRKIPVLDIKLLDVYEPLRTQLSVSVQISQSLQFLQGFAVPMILTQLYDDLMFASVITQYRICMALISSAGTLALSEWSSIDQDEFDRIEPTRTYRIQMLSQLMKNYLLLIGFIAASIPVIGTFIWDFLSSNFPNPPLISWLLWGFVLFFYESFTILSIVETRLGRYDVLLYLNLSQFLSCSFLFYLPFLQSNASYPLNIAFSYLVAILGTSLIKR